MMRDQPELRRRAANYVTLSPVSFLQRAAAFFGDRTAVLHGARRYTYAEFYARARRLAHALTKAGIRSGDTVAIIAANTPAMLEAHYAAPMIGAVLNPINIRLDASSIAFCLRHGEARLLLADREFHPTVHPALDELGAQRPIVIDIADAETADMPRFGGVEYEDFIASGQSDFDYPGVTDEWASICLLYTSGTTGNPKGAVYSHRGAYLGALSNAMTFKLDHESRYLWTLPMFHCSGWTYTWAVTAAGATHVCLRKTEPKRIFDAIVEHKVTHMCGAPIVLNMLVHAPADAKRPLPVRTRVATGGAAPPAIVIERMEQMGFEVLHLYGTTESYGPASYCAPMHAWAQLDTTERYVRMARQGIPTPVVEQMVVADPQTLQPVPRDGQTVGEIMMTGNTLMKGYLKNPAATDEAFAGGVYRTGDLAVWHYDGTIEVKDRAKDIIISGGENISSLEVEEVLYRHPQVMEAAVVARPDEKWGETPCAFVTLKPGSGEVTEKDIIVYCRANMAHFKVPKVVVFGPLPKTSTGKIQKFVLRDKARSVS
ncbi:MAG TPA: long-chain-fatty-acid--CoA ligase [Hyphomicrobiaceae bacterium]|nr:long-chain-fatty-acid--CoA ligase [Hyphomicrobiaceae bacterium]